MAGVGGLGPTVSIPGWGPGVRGQRAGEGRIFPELPASPWQCANPGELTSLEPISNPAGRKEIGLAR